MSYIVKGPTTKAIPNVFWARVVSAPPYGATWQRDDEAPIPLYGLQTMRAKEYTIRGASGIVRKPFRLSIVGWAQVEISTDPAEPFADAVVGTGGASATTSTSTTDSGIIVIPAGGAATLIAPADPARTRGISIQNMGTNVVFVSKVGTVTAAGANAAATLSAGGALNDGTGGTVTFDGWAGPVYATTADSAVGRVMVSAY